MLNHKLIKNLSNCYYLISVLIFFCEVFKFKPFIYILNICMVLNLVGLYYFSTQIRVFYYYLALSVSCLSILFFVEKTNIRLFYGAICYSLYLFLDVFLVWKKIRKNNILPIFIATVPFLFLSVYLINLTQDVLLDNFYPAIVIGLLISSLCGLSLYSFLFHEDRMSIWLIISSVLILIQICTFLIQKYYISNLVFEPLIAIIYTVSHYVFYKFMITNNDLVEDIS